MVTTKEGGGRLDEGGARTAAGFGPSNQVARMQMSRAEAAPRPRPQPAPVTSLPHISPPSLAVSVCSGSDSKQKGAERARESRQGGARSEGEKISGISPTPAFLTRATSGGVFRGAEGWICTDFFTPPPFSPSVALSGSSACFSPAVVHWDRKEGSTVAFLLFSPPFFFVSSAPGAG
ncbi:hypothetical protein MHYP_G00220920 [Metynnis hypsauchen]